MRHRSQGRLKYSIDDTGHKLIVEADPGIASFYLALIPKYLEAKPQKYPAHISVVRREAPVRMEAWGRHEGQVVDFEYEGVVRTGQVYFWVNVFSTRLEEVRAELGLPVDSPFTLPPEGFVKCFHLTVGNRKPVPGQKKLT